MKVGFVGSVFYETVFEDHPLYIFGKALLDHGVESVYYVPIKRLNRQIKIRHLNDSNYTVFIPCSISFIGKGLDRIEKRSLFTRRIVEFVGILYYLVQVVSRIPEDKIDVYVIQHIWSRVLPLLNPILKKFRPVAILYQGSSLFSHRTKYGLLYNFLVPFYKLAFRKCAIITPLGIEQETALFKVLKLPERDVYPFNIVCLDEKLFHERDKEQSAKKAEFDTKNFNILSMSRILDPDEPERRWSLNYTKNIFLVVEMFRFLAKKSSLVHLHITGKGNGMKKLKATVSRYGLEDRVTVHGWIPNELRPVFISAADLIINPYPLVEFNDAAAIFEGFICGKSVVAFKRYSWVTTEKKGGFLIDQNPEIGAQQVLSRLNPDYLEKKRKEAKEIPYEQNVPRKMWGREMKRNLVNHIRKHS